MTTEFGVFQGGLSEEESERKAKLFNSFVREFESTLVELGVLHDFSLQKVYEEALDGKVDFRDREKEVYDKIRDLITVPPNAAENAMAVPEEMREAA